MDSDRLFERSSLCFPKGVNSPVRFFEPRPFFTDHAKGSRLYTVDGEELVDYCMAYGSLIFGHASEYLVRHLRDRLSKGTVYGTPTEQEVVLAEEVRRAFPSIEMVRFVNSGGEATSTAVRLTRAYTGREIVVKFDGGYHGAVDYLMINGTGESRSVFSAGVPAAASDLTRVLPYNNFSALDSVGEDVACVIMEPTLGNVGLIPPKPGYLEEVRVACNDSGAVLIFDEVITGFRLARGGAQERFGVRSDLTTLGKVLGGGLPIGAVGGREDIMRRMSPEGEAFSAGTFNGNPISVTAGIATLRRLHSSVYSSLRGATERLCRGIEDALSEAELDSHVSRLESLFTVFFTDDDVVDYAAAKTSNLRAFKTFHHSLLRQGVYLPPSQFECSFLSTAHTKEDVERTIMAALMASSDVRLERRPNP